MDRLIFYRGELNIRDSGNLPHWEMDNGLYFITFRLADSLPKDVYVELCKTRDEEREKFVEATEPSPLELAHFELEYELGRFDSELDRGLGACWLERPDIAQLVATALEYFHNERYRLFNWCIMPNHVHAQLQLFNGDDLDSVLHSWKSYTATKANEMLDRVGEAFWQREYFDHLIRTEGSFNSLGTYIQQNPSHAGLEDWDWVRSYRPEGWKPSGT